MPFLYDETDSLSILAYEWCTIELDLMAKFSLGYEDSDMKVGLAEFVHFMNFTV